MADLVRLVKQLKKTHRAACEADAIWNRLKDSGDAAGKAYGRLEAAHTAYRKAIVDLLNVDV